MSASRRRERPPVHKARRDLTSLGNRLPELNLALSLPPPTTWGFGINNSTSNVAAAPKPPQQTGGHSSPTVKSPKNSPERKKRRDSTSLGSRCPDFDMSSTLPQQSTSDFGLNDTSSIKTALGNYIEPPMKSLSAGMEVARSSVQAADPYSAQMEEKLSPSRTPEMASTEVDHANVGGSPTRTRGIDCLYRADGKQSLHFEDAVNRSSEAQGHFEGESQAKVCDGMDIDFAVHLDLRNSKESSQTSEEKRAVKNMTSSTKVLIDGANVCARKMKHNQEKIGSYLSIEGFLLAREYFARLGVATVCFLPDHWRSSVTSADQQTLEDLEMTGELIFTPSQDDDDHYVLSYARRHNYFILTNDLFRDHIARETNGQHHKDLLAWVKERCISFTFVGDELLPNPLKEKRLRDELESRRESF